MHTHRRLLLALALVVTLAVTFLAAPPPIQADRCGNEFYYYDDAAHTNLVGYEVYECNCAHSSWGVHTFYRVIEPLGC
ncbi:MAG TPA: DUF6289 family protein [Thermoanaerobaculia bacterium]